MSEDQSSSTPSNRAAAQSLGKRQAGWAGRYPALLECLKQGRAPTEQELEIVATRIRRELGIKQSSGPSRRHPSRLQRRIDAMARLALEGQRFAQSALESPRH